MSSAPRGPLIRVSTRCVSIDELVAKFAGFASEGALVLPAAGELPIGTEGRFVIRLLDQSVAMRGRCRVTDVKSVPAGPSVDGARRVLLRVALLDLEEASRQAHARLLAHRRQAVPLPVTGSESEPTIVSARGSVPASPRSSVPPPPVRRPPPAPVAAQTRTMIGIAPAVGQPGRPPAVSPLARTMIGAPAATSPVPGKVPGPPAIGRRVPGAAYTLRANPLGALQAEDLASFIDSTLFEVDDEEATVERAAPPPTEIDVPIDEVAMTSAAPSTSSASGVRAPQTSDEAAAVIAAPVTIARTERTSVIPTRATTTTTKRSAALRLAPSAVCLVVGLAIGHLWLSPGRKSAPAPARDDRSVSNAPASAAPVGEGAPVGASAPAAPAPAVPIAIAPAPAAAPNIAEPAVVAAAPQAAAVRQSVTSAAPGECSAHIITEPPEAKIVWGGKLLGASPIERAPIPCGSATVAIEHERYQPITQVLAAEPGTPVVVSQRLHRPPGALIVASSPARAYITVNDQMLGPAPRRLAAWRYEQVSIRATYPGYQPWTKKIYLKEPTTNVTAQLVPTRHADGQRAAAAR